MRVIGIDPGLTRCGIGIIDATPSRSAHLVYVSVVRTPPMPILRNAFSLLILELTMPFDNLHRTLSLSSGSSPTTTCVPSWEPHKRAESPLFVPREPEFPSACTPRVKSRRPSRVMARQTNGKSGRWWHGFYVSMGCPRQLTRPMRSHWRFVTRGVRPHRLAGTGARNGMTFSPPPSLSLPRKLHGKTESGRRGKARNRR